MRIEITQDISGIRDYRWKLITGPDGVDHYEGIAGSIGEAFEKVLIAETVNAQHYYGGTEND